MKLREIIEAKQDTAVMAFGRMNPPTIGHQKLVDKIKSLPGDPYLFLSQSQKPKTDPLDFQTKLKFAKYFFPGITIGSPQVKTIIQALDKIHDLGYKNLVYVAGSDRVDDFETLINKYNGGEGYNFDSIQVVSAGERDPDAKGAEGMSASKMRELARSEDFEQFAQGVPDQNLADELYTAVRKGMGLTQGDLEMSDAIENSYFEEFVKSLNKITEGKLDEFETPYFSEEEDEEGPEDADDLTGFKEESVQSQLMKIADSEPGDDIKNPVRTVKTDDGKIVEVEHGEAVAILELLSMNVKPEVKLQVQKMMQNSDGLAKVIEFVTQKGMVS